MNKFIDDKTKKKYARLTLKWCESFFGYNERKKYKPKLVFKTQEKKYKNSLIYGNYCFYRNIITIFLPNNTTVKDIISTTIHEYTHYLQKRLKYRVYEQYYYYSTNPYEREAKRNEEKYTDTCLKDIKKLITQ